MKQDACLTWHLSALPFAARAQKADQKTLTVTADDERLTCEIYYDFHEKPLILTGSQAPRIGDSVSLALMPHRIELYINGRLEDEEWPAGERLWDAADAWIGVPAELSPTSPAEEEPPAVVGTFRSAEGWRPAERIFVGDCMPYVKDDRYHVLYLKDRRHHKSKWGLGAHQWEHISTRDFDSWEIHPMAVAVTAPHEGSICTGSWMRCEGREYLFYTIRMSDRSPAHICRSISEDGYHFRKDKAFCFTLSEKYHAVSARDPKVIRAADGLFHMFLTTSLQESGRGCLAHLTSTDLHTWREEETPIYTAADATQPECPDYIAFAGRYYLIYSLHGKAHYLIGEQPFGPWRAPKDPIIPCHSVPKGGVWGERIIFTGFRPLGGYAGTMTFVTARAAENGELIFEREECI